LLAAARVMAMLGYLAVPMASSLTAPPRNTCCLTLHYRLCVLQRARWGEHDPPTGRLSVFELANLCEGRHQTQGLQPRPSLRLPRKSPFLPAIFAEDPRWRACSDVRPRD